MVCADSPEISIFTYSKCAEEMKIHHWENKVLSCVFEEITGIKAGW